jgi:hypothetical protein
MTDMTMLHAEPGPGEQAAQARRRRLMVRMTVLAAFGAAIGFTAALVERRGAPILAGGTIAPAFAVAAAIAMVVIQTIACIRYYREIDELQRLDNLMASATGGNLVIVGYPIWFLLWKGGLAPVPDALIIFGAVFATAMLTYLWRKLR